MVASGDVRGMEVRCEFWQLCCGREMATVILRLAIERGLSCDEIMSTFARQYRSELERFLVPEDLSGKDMRAQYSHESFGIDAVEKDEMGAYLLRYQYGWEAYYGCRDMCNGDIEVEEVKFRYRSGEAIFQKVEIEKRSTVDEF